MKLRPGSGEVMVMQYGLQEMKRELGPTSKCYRLAASRSTFTMRRSGQGKTCFS